MSDGAPASLTSSLLAKKGEARPAALPEDNYSPFTKTADRWRGEKDASSGAERNGGDPAAPTLFDALDDDAKGDNGAAEITPEPDEERPEANLGQIRVQRSERVRLQPAVNDPTDVGPPAPDAAADAGEEALDREIAPDAPVAEPADSVIERAAHAALENEPADEVPQPGASEPDAALDVEAEAVEEPAETLNGAEPEAVVEVPEAEPVSEAPAAAFPVAEQPTKEPPFAMPPEIAAAALRQEAPVWRRHMTTFGLSFLVGGALAFVGWSIYSKGNFGAPPVEPPVAAKAETPTKQPAGQLAAERSPAVAPAVPALAAAPAATTRPAGTAPAAAPTDAAKPQVLSVRFADDGRATIVGTAAANSQVVLLDNGALLATVTADGEGIWSYLGDAALADGSHNFAVAAVATTVAARVSTTPAGTSGSETIDTAPAVSGTGVLSRPLPPPADERPAVAPAAKPSPAAKVGETAADEQAEDVVEDARINPSVVPLPAERRDRSAAATPTTRYVVQLASVPSEADAMRFWEKLSEREPELTGQHHLLVHTGTLPQGRTVFRVRAGPFQSRQAAQQACRNFREVTRDCLVVKRLETPS